MAGMSLKEIKAQQQPENALNAFSELVKANTLSLNSMMTTRSAQYSLPIFEMSDSQFGWTVNIGNHQLSGFGVRPNEEQLVAIEQILKVDLKESNSPKDSEV